LIRCLLGAVAVCGTAILPATALDYPSVGDLEAGLQLRPGLTLPKLILARGHLWSVRYLGATRTRHGVYTVRVVLTLQEGRQ